MKYLLNLLLLTLVLLVACKKDAEPEPPVTYNPTVSFATNRYGAAALVVDAASKTPKVPIYVMNAAPGLKFTYEVTGSNGMKLSTDTILSGNGIVGTGDTTSIFIQHYFDYKDGTLNVKVKFDSTAATITSSVEKEEFLIRDYKDLMAISFLRSSSDNSFLQMQDINFPVDTTLGKAPISTLHGNYDGQGYKITNLKIESIALPPSYLLGLIGQAENSVVKNVRLELSIIAKGPPNSTCYYGGIVGLALGGSIINSSVIGNIDTDNSPISFVGGIVGGGQGTKVIGCSFSGYLKGATIGGIVGLSNKVSVKMCYCNATMDGNAAGTILGRSYGAQLQNEVSNSYAYISAGQVNRLLSLYYVDAEDNYNNTTTYTNCFSNTGIVQKESTMYSTATELNNHLSALSVTSWPDGITAPEGNKPFKAGADPNQPMILWWQ